MQHLYPDGKTSRPQGAEFNSPVMFVPTVITYLVVGCQRKLVVYSWKDGEAQDIKVRHAEIFHAFLMTMLQEAPLPHSARTIAFLDHEVVCLAYEAGHVLFSLATMSTTEIASASTTNKSGAGIGNVGMGAFAGLGGYMSLGLGAKLRPCVTNAGDAEVLIAKDSTCIHFFPDSDLNISKTRAFLLALMVNHRVKRKYPGLHLRRTSASRLNVQLVHLSYSPLFRPCQAIHSQHLTRGKRTKTPWRRHRYCPWPTSLPPFPFASGTLFNIPLIISVAPVSIQLHSNYTFTSSPR